MDIGERRESIRSALREASSAMSVTIAQLAGLLGVSKRTVQYDLAYLADEWKQRGVRLCRQAHRGLWLEGVGTGVAAEMVPSPVYSQKERQDRIILALLGAEKVSIDQLAERLYVSRTTLLADLQEVQDVLSRRGLRYASKRGLGIWAEGDEQAVRDMFIHIFNRSSYDFRRFSSASEAGRAAKPFYAYAVGVPVQAVADAFLSLMAERGILGNDMAVNRMMCALVVAMCRLEVGHGMPASEDDVLSMASSEAYCLAGDIQTLMVTFDDRFASSGERLYLLRELLHSRLFSLPVKETSSTGGVDDEALELARRFIGYVQAWLGDVYLDDDERVYNLALHLQPAIERARFGILLTNPLLGSIQERYASLYAVSQRAAERLSEETGIVLSDDEVSYLAVHVGAAVERRKRQRKKHLSVLLVCGSGIGTANLLAMTLENNLPYIEVVKSVSFYRLREEDWHHVDIIISTVDLDSLPPGVAVLRVSPILSDAEIRVIEGQVNHLYRQKFSSEARHPVRAEAENRLLSLLQEDMIALDVEVVDWEQAVEKAGQLLSDSGAVTDAYVQQMVRVVRRLGPYIVVRDGVAMPHAASDDGARRVAVSFLRLRQPVVFAGREEKRADLFFAFSTIDETAHLPLITDLWHVFNDESLLAHLRTAWIPSEVLALLRDFLPAASGE